MRQRIPFRFALPILVLVVAGCESAQVRCGPGTFAVRGDGSGRYVDQDGSGRYIDQDGRPLTRARGGVRCAAVTPPTVCGPGTVRVDMPYAVFINPDGSGRYVDQDGRGRWVDQDGTIRAGRICLMGEMHVPEGADGRPVQGSTAPPAAIRSSARRARAARSRVNASSLRRR